MARPEGRIALIDVSGSSTGTAADGRRLVVPPPGTFRRSVALFRAFRVEQTDPDYFYGMLAADSARQVAGYADLDGKTVLDVGGGPGYFADAFRRSGARYVGIDADLGELAARSEPGPGTLLGSGMALPIQTGAIDVCYSSNVLEHVDKPELMADEMVRVTKPGGVVFLSYMLWWGPYGGHETAPWHYLGGHYAARRYAKKQGHPPKNVFGESLFRITAGRMVHWAKQRRADGRVEILDIVPRYHPNGFKWVVHVPGVREIVTWNLVLVLRVR
ncbi:class I SAM-dependent methyltransferase [Cryptosporangium aurantiacum]|uniref:class I SAM-dependent methyltransferase n=1 Tax=Cryptosporangium aurantiacum TaxID=134849 RepID=UPI001C49D15C|nr:class I SAM-dependent methyltransferase [Cryptosporangium aurantiacum]